MKQEAPFTYWENRHIEHVKNQVAKAVMQYGLIDNDDHIMVAVSGGKDSLVLLSALAAFRKFNKVDFHLEAIHIDVEDVPYRADRDFLTHYCQSLDIPFHFKQIEADLEHRGKKAPCFVCSWHRRKFLFEFTKKRGFQKLALGHHMDDAVETLLMNMAYHGHVSSLPAKLKMFNGALHLIRPLMLLTDKDTRKYAEIMQFPELLTECPYADATKRTTARKLIETLQDIHPKATHNIFNSLSQIDHEYLPEGGQIGE
ncbi:MAG: adenine nucleotide alpha hydrolase family protein [Bacteroidales bacterium]|nr:adenine nucleotide alpha hydrolase family protein [Bacteroidales bacterium]